MVFMHVFMYWVISLVKTLWIATLTVEASFISELPGHYPYVLCKLQNAIFVANHKTFYYSVDNENSDHSRKCEITRRVWPVDVLDQEQANTTCDLSFKHGHAFTIYYWGGISNYYHLTYDMMLPLYVQLYHNKGNKDWKQGDALFMPTVESRRLQMLDWNTPAFRDPSMYWVDMAKFMAEDQSFFPLDDTFIKEKKNVCFEELYFGTAPVPFGDSSIIQSFVKYVKSRLGIEDTKRAIPHRLALVSRKGRRKILNEKEVVDALPSLIPSDLIEFSGMTFAQQVHSMQKYTVFAALNGAGLMNALYLPQNSVTIQMVPFEAHLNVDQYGTLLKARGPYLEWHNTHQNLTRPYPGDTYNNRPDTIVHIDDFKAKVSEAMRMYDRYMKGTSNTHQEL